MVLHQYEHVNLKDPGRLLPARMAMPCGYAEPAIASLVSAAASRSASPDGGPYRTTVRDRRVVVPRSASARLVRSPSGARSADPPHCRIRGTRQNASTEHRRKKVGRSRVALSTERRLSVTGPTTERRGRTPTASGVFQGMALGQMRTTPVDAADPRWRRSSSVRVVGASVVAAAVDTNLRPCYQVFSPASDADCLVLVPISRLIRAAGRQQAWPPPELAVGLSSPVVVRVGSSPVVGAVGR
jgi:hypothetical protein